MMVPVGRLVLLRTVAKDELVTAMAYLTVPALIGPVVGPLLGGFIVTYFSGAGSSRSTSRSAMLGLVLVTLFIPDMREGRPPPFDLAGFALSAVGLAGLMFGFETIGRGIVPSWRRRHCWRSGRCASCSMSAMPRGSLTRCSISA